MKELEINEAVRHHFEKTLPFELEDILLTPKDLPELGRRRAWATIGLAEEAFEMLEVISNEGTEFLPLVMGSEKSDAFLSEVGDVIFYLAYLYKTCPYSVAESNCFVKGDGVTEAELMAELSRIIGGVKKTDYRQVGHSISRQDIIALLTKLLQYTAVQVADQTALSVYWVSVAFLKNKVLARYGK